MAIRVALLVVVIAAVGLFGWIFFLNPEALSVLRQWAGDSAIVGEPPQTDSFSEEGDIYSIKVQYPSQLPLADAEAEARAQALMKEGIGEAVEEFRQFADSAMMSAEELAVAQERPYALDITHEEYTSSKGVSYVYLIYSDTGGAHPNAFFRTFTFDQQGIEILLEDLFMPGSAYLQRISEKVYAGVLEQLEEKSGTPVTPDMEEIVRMGTSPTPETLQFFYLTGADLHIIIPPYQAASWAAGDFDVAIAFSELQDILR